MSKKKTKGEYGYINYQKTWTLIRTILYFSISLALYLAGIIQTGSNRNLLTVFAVLGFLPASKSLVNWIMFLRARACDARDYERIIAADAKRFPILFDMEMTAYKETYHIASLFVCQKNIIAYSSFPINEQEFYKHVTGILHQNHKNDYTIKVFKECDKYINRLNALNELKQSDEASLYDEEVLTLLLEISL